MNRYKTFTAAGAIAAALFAAATPVAAAPKAKAASVAPATPALPDIAVNFETFTLPNGLRVVVHEDRKAPVVGVNIWYHVGSKNEPTGRSGFAHLFEHLMFNGSENFNKDWFKALETMGATGMNGTTNVDRTNYFQTVPTGTLDAVLWLESDRMGHLLGAVDQAKLDEQRGVVKNEKRQGENQPYGQVWTLITENSYPDDHPYGHTVIGSMDDLNAAKLEDVQAWFKDYYGAANAVLVLAGDIDAKTAKEKVTKYFGALPAGKPLPRAQEWINKRTEATRVDVQDRVPQARVYRVWNTPGYGSDKSIATDAALSAYANVLGGGKTSRLYQRLVLKENLASEVSAFQNGSEIAGQFLVVATARPGADVARIEAIIDEEIARLKTSGATAAELNNYKVSTYAQFARGLERVGGFGGKSDLLAESTVYFGRPDGYKVQFDHLKAMTSATMTAAAKEWIDDKALTITVHPFAAKDGNMAQDADRKQLPAITDVKDPGFDAYQTATLKNGTKVLFARRTTTPVVSVTVGLPLGSGHDPAGKSGLAALTANLLDEGAGKRDATAIAETAESLGATLGTAASATHTVGTVSSLTATLDASLDLLGDVLRNPTFPAADFERLRRQTIDGIKRQKVTPAVANTQALRLAFGEAHPFGRPANESSLAAITLDDVKGFYAGADLSKGYIIVTGDTTLEAVLPKLDARFGNWAPAKPAPAPVDFTQVSTAKPAIYLIDRPNAPQSQIVAINTVAPFDVATEADVEMANKIFGGAFISRLNMNLREDKGWSYGARSGVAGTFGPRAMTASAGVQSDKTKESLVEMRKELSDILGGRPITQSELADAVGDSVKALPGQYETAGAVAGSLQAMASRNLPGDYYNTYTARLRGVTLDSVNKTAKTLFKPSETIYVIAGDRAKVEAGLSELAKSWNIPLMHIDADGKPVK